MHRRGEEEEEDKENQRGGRLQGKRKEEDLHPLGESQVGGTDGEIISGPVTSS